MAAPHTITTEKLNRLIGTPSAPVIFDVCIDEDFALDQRIIPGSQRKNFKTVAAGRDAAEKPRCPVCVPCPAAKPHPSRCARRLRRRRED